MTDRTALRRPCACGLRGGRRWCPAETTRSAPGPVTQACDGYDAGSWWRERVARGRTERLQQRSAELTDRGNHGKQGRRLPDGASDKRDLEQFHAPASPR